MDRATEMEFLVTAIDQGSFTAAADRLGLTPSAISKAISRLEDRLGVRLVERTTRRSALTTEGRTFYDSARRILGDIGDAEASVMEFSGRPQGLLTVNSSVAFALSQLAPALPDFVEAYPDIRLDLQIADRRIDIIAENIDIGIRTGPVGDERLVGRMFNDFCRVVVASPAYLARRGTPTHPDELARHICINHSATPGLATWPFRVGHEIRQIETRSAVLADAAASTFALVLAGVGISRLAGFIVAEAVRDGRLVPLFEDCHVSEPVPLHLVYPPGRQRLPKVRVFLDFISRRFGANVWKL
jgi:DNA-binding transcriptional LysR family regulator